MLWIALATLTSAGASGAQISAAKAHRKAPVSGSARVRYRHAATRSVHRAAQERARAAPKLKPTPDEVGRAAGLAIRRELEKRQVERRYAALRVEHERAQEREEAERISSPPDSRSTQRAAAVADSPRIARRAPEMSEAQPRKSAAEPRQAERMARADEEAAVEPERVKGQQSGDEEAAGDDAADAAHLSDSVAAQGREDDQTDAQNGMHAERDQENAGTPHGADEWRGAAEPDDGEGLDQESRDASLNAEKEEASLWIPRGEMPKPLYGSLASLERQNERLEAEGLERIEDEDDLQARIAEKLLVPLPVSNALMVNANLAVDRRYCRPWTAKFLSDLARAHDALFHKPLEVNSAVRTVEYQKRLMEINGNAAPAEGDIVSPHLTGATVDIAKEGLNRAEIAWMRRRLLALQDAGKIDVEEEFQQACFHVTVYKTYAPPRTPRAGSRTNSPKRRTRPSVVPDVNAAATVVGM